MDRSPLHILIVDDSPEDRLTLRRLLTRFAPGAYAISEADNGERALAQCRTMPLDCIVLDQHLPDLDGLDVLTDLRTFADVPVVLLTGLSSEHLAVEAFQRGAQDYLIKAALTPERLHLTIQRAVSTIQLVRERNQTLALLTTMLDTIPIGIAVLDSELRILQVNPALADLMGQSWSFLRGELFLSAWSDLASALAAPCNHVLQGESFADLELCLPTPDALPARWISVSGTPVRSADGIGSLGLITAQDISARKQAERAIQQAAARLQVLADASRAFVAAGVDPHMVLDQIAQIIADALAAGCLIHLRSADLQWLDTVTIYDQNPSLRAAVQAIYNGVRIHIDSSDMAAQVVRSGRSVLYTQISHDLVRAALEPALWPALDLLSPYSALILPLQAHGQMMGSLALIRHLPGLSAFTQDDMALAQDLADRAALALANVRLYQEVQAAQHAAAEALSRLDALVDSAPNGIGYLDRELRYQLVNPALAAISGFSPDDHIGRTLPEMLSGFASQIEPLARHVLMTGVSARDVEISGPVRDPAAGIQTWLVSYFPVPGSGGEITGVGVLVTNITTMRRTEVALRDTERKLGTLFDLLPVGISILDDQRKLVYMNPTLEQILQRDRTLLFGEAYRDQHFIRPDGTPMLVDEHASSQTFATHRAVSNVETGVVIEDGTVIWTSVSAAPVDFPDWRVVVVTTDITARKHAEKELLRFAERLQMLHTIDRSILSAETPERIAAIAASRLQQLVPCDYVLVAAYNHEEQFIQKLSVTSQVSEQPEMDAVISIDSQDLRPPFALNLRWYLSDNTDIARLSPQALFPYIRNFRSIMHFPLLAEGQLLGILRIAATSADAFAPADITIAGELADLLAIVLRGARLRAQLEEERAQLAQRVAERTADLSMANADLARAARAKDEFLANMSHELRTPLNAILAFSESLQEGIYGPISQRQIDALTAIETGGRHLLTLISDILDLAKVESGQLDLQFEKVAIAEVCQASLMFVREQAIKKNLRLSVRQYDHLASMQADPKRLKQMLVNLLSNAVKFTPDQGEVTLDVAIDAEAGLVRFTVQDTGIGIATEHIGQLFQPFTQLDSALSRQHEGTGLGLALVRRLVDLHAGTVTVESRLGKGSRFTISLPYTAPPALKSEDSLLIAPDVDSHTLSTPPTFRARILLAEDHPANIFALGEYLRASAYEVIVAQNGYEALARAEEVSPQLILMDIQMPGMDGLETMRRLRQIPAFAQTPIIALTALAMPDDRERCLAAGATTYMTKPISAL